MRANRTHDLRAMIRHCEGEGAAMEYDLNDLSFVERMLGELPSCVFFKDRDCLKRANDTLGHAMGDNYIRSVKALWSLHQH